MKRLLIVVDMQNDFVAGALGSPHAEKIVPDVKVKIEEYRRRGDRVIFTRDTHTDKYPDTQEGKLLPVVHCVAGTYGHGIISELETDGCEIFDKPSFGSLELARMIADGADCCIQDSADGDISNRAGLEAGAITSYDEIELCGLCTDICVVSNALILKAQLPEVRIIVDANCCAGVTMESHEAALLTMKMCQVIVTGV